METLSQKYGLRFATINRLVEMGALPRARHQKSDGRRIDGFPIEDIECFFSRHSTLRDLARTHDCSWQLMKPLLARLGVRPLIAEQGHTLIYAISELPDTEKLAREVDAAKARNARFRRAK